VKEFDPCTGWKRNNGYVYLVAKRKTDTSSRPQQNSGKIT
jgi:hypothetical protein